MNLLDLMYQEQARTLARRTDPDTSREAAEAIVPSVNRIQKEVLDYAMAQGIGGFTDRMLCEHFNNHGSTYRTRRSELTAKGLIVDSGNRVLVGTKKHILWLAAEHARSFFWTGRAAS